MFTDASILLQYQVLSESTSKALMLTIGPEAAETAKFVSMLIISLTFSMSATSLTELDIGSRFNIHTVPVMTTD